MITFFLVYLGLPLAAIAVLVRDANRKGEAHLAVRREIAAAHRERMKEAVK